MTLAAQFDPRRNSLTALRLAFASLVALEHAYELGGFGDDPLAALTGVKLGEFAVNAFFAISGFLVARSWLAEPTLGAFLLKRILRIFPGLWVCLLVTGLGVFPWVAHRLGSAPWPQAIADPSFTGYVWKNSLLKIQQMNVGGLFVGHPAAGVANGSLWSLLPEFLCYLAIAGLGVLGALRVRPARIAWIVALALYAAHVGAPIVWPGLHDGLHGPGWWLWRFATQATFFAGGALLQLHVERIDASGRIVAAVALMLLAGTFASAYQLVAPLALPFLLITLSSRLPGTSLDRYGDYSYGVYVYHYPVEQVLYAFGLRPTSPAGYFALTLAFTLPLAIASWHLVERPALRLKRRLRASRPRFTAPKAQTNPP